MTEEQNKLAEEMEQALAVSSIRSGPIPITFHGEEQVKMVIAALREPATEAVLEDEYDQKSVDIIKNLAMLVRRLCYKHPNDKLTDQAMAYLRGEKLEGSILRTALKGKGASQGAEGVGLTVHEADIIAAAVQLVPLLEEGWDEYDAPEGQNEGARACDALVKAVNAMLQAPDEQKG